MADGTSMTSSRGSNRLSGGAPCDPTEEVLDHAAPQLQFERSPTVTRLQVRQDPSAAVGVFSVPKVSSASDRMRISRATGSDSSAVNARSLLTRCRHSGRLREPVAVVRRGIVKLRPDGHDARRVDGFVAAVVVRLDVVQVHGLGDARHLVEVAQVV
jgi:hypothetical protein